MKSKSIIKKIKKEENNMNHPSTERGNLFILLANVLTFGMFDKMFEDAD